MKKIVIFLVCSIFLYAVDVQVATPTPLASGTKTVGKSLQELMKDVKINNYKAHEPAQFTLNVPVDIESPKAGTLVPIPPYNITLSGQQELVCGIYSTTNPSNYYAQVIALGQGITKKTIVFKFNNIPNNLAMRIDEYRCEVAYIGSDGNYYSPNNIFDEGTFSTRIFSISGEIK